MLEDSKIFSDNWGGAHTVNIDGSGKLASVDPETAENILQFIKGNIIDVKRVLDIGAGQGILQSVFDRDGAYETWSMEGSSEVPFQADRARRISADATIPFTDEYDKAFDLVVSFECIEHIREDYQNAFWNNVFFCASRALVSIHCLNGEHANHCHIRNEEWWTKYFEDSGISYEILGRPESPWEVWPRANCSLIFLLEKREEHSSQDITAIYGYVNERSNNHK
jgi:hypothetical protein